MTRKRRRESSFEDYESYEEDGERDFDHANSQRSDGSDFEDSDGSGSEGGSVDEEGSVDASLDSRSDGSEEWAASDANESEGEPDNDIEDSDDDQLADNDLASHVSSDSGSDPLPEPIPTSSSPLERLPSAIRTCILQYVVRDPLATMSLALSSKFFYKNIFRGDAKNIFRGDAAWAKTCRSFGRRAKSPACRTWRATYFVMMHRKCIWCGKASIANIGKIIRRAPNWLACCVPCQSVVGPYQVCNEREAIRMGTASERLRALPFKLSRVPRFVRKGMKRFLHKGRYEKQFLKADAVSLLPYTHGAMLEGDDWRALYKGKYASGLDKIVSEVRLGRHTRLVDLARYVLGLPDPQQHDFDVLSSYYDSLQQTLFAAKEALELHGLKSLAYKFKLSKAPPKPTGLPRRASWVELLVDPDHELCLQTFVEMQSKFWERKKAKRVKREKRQATQRVGTNGSSQRTTCSLPTCTAARKRDCPNELCGVHCPGCPKHKPKAGREPPAAARQTIRRAVEMEEDDEKPIRAKSEKLVQHAGPATKRLKSEG